MRGDKACSPLSVIAWSDLLLDGVAGFDIVIIRCEV